MIGPLLAISLGAVAPAAQAQDVHVIVISEPGATRLSRTVEAELRSVGLTVRALTVADSAPPGSPSAPAVINCGADGQAIEIYFRDAQARARIAVGQTDRGAGDAAIAVTELVRARGLIAAPPIDPDASNAPPPAPTSGAATELTAPPIEAAASNAPPLGSTSGAATELAAPPRLERNASVLPTEAEVQEAEARRTEREPPTRAAPTPDPDAEPVGEHESLASSALELGVDVAYGDGSMLPSTSVHLGTTLRLFDLVYVHARGALQVIAPSQTQGPSTIDSALQRVEIDAGLAVQLGDSPVFVQAGVGIAAVHVEVTGRTSDEILTGGSADTWTAWPFGVGQVRVRIHQNVSIYADTAVGALLSQTTVVTPPGTGAPPEPPEFDPAFDEGQIVADIGHLFVRSSAGVEVSWDW